jgi:hypothetical protein
MNIKVKTRDGRDAIIIDMNGPNPECPIAAWTTNATGQWFVVLYRSDGRYLPAKERNVDLMLTTYKYRAEYVDEIRAYWWPAIDSVLSVGHKISRGTFDMDGNLIDICLLTDAEIEELRAV